MDATASMYNAIAGTKEYIVKMAEKMRIVSSSEHINASALNGGVYIAGDKVYKWGKTRQLDQ